jgi:DNA-binding IclR family transcriptional regulator
MSQGRFIVLMMLNRDPEKLFMPSQLAELCSVTKATMTGLVDGLEREGLVTRHLAGGPARHARWPVSERAGSLDRILPPHFERVAALMQDLANHGAPGISPAACEGSAAVLRG